MPLSVTSLVCLHNNHNLDTKYLMQELKVRRHLKDLGVHGRTTLKPILHKQNMKFQMGIIRRTTGLTL
jgi:hypothetical protein